VAQLRVERQQYALADGLYAAGVFNMLLRHAGHVTMANQAQLVNLLGLIETTPTTAYPTGEYRAFSLYVAHIGPVAIAVQAEGPTFAVRPIGTMPARPREPYLDVAATRDRDGRRLWLHVVNRHPQLAITTRIDLDGAVVAESILHVLQGRGPWSRNTPENQEVVTIRHERMDWDGTAPIAFPACSASSLEIVLA
jgi:alpha-N-arabinofuranosidase